jgi:hypothetical protein
MLGNRSTHWFSPSGTIVRIGLCFGLRVGEILGPGDDEQHQYQFRGLVIFQASTFAGRGVKRIVFRSF